MKGNWIKKRVSKEEAEKNHMVLSKALDPSPVPFGFQNAEWNKLVSQMKEGDELWEYASAPDTWKKLSGRAGILLIRDGKTVDGLVTRMS